jgi:RND superfamily putative drug exporter
MILVFASFILGGERVIKEFGIGLAAGIAVDAVLIRMAVVPSLMMMFGQANWWFPAWLDRWLPKLSVDADDLVIPAPSPSPEPEPELAGSGSPSR